MKFDVLIVGGGLAGSLLADVLSARGAQVAVVERGSEARTQVPRERSFRAKLQAKLFPSRAASYHPDRYSAPIYVQQGSPSSRYQAIPAIMGEGLGGSSLLFGAALGRLRRSDFEEDTRASLSAEGAQNMWPIGYDEILPYYHQAEAKMRVYGTRDTLDPDDDAALRMPPPLNARDGFIVDRLHANGHQPFRIHMGMDYLAGCTECQGVRCVRGCKADGWSRALSAAAERPNLSLILGHQVHSLVEDKGGVSITIKDKLDHSSTLQASVVVITAGALNTPLILARSAPRNGWGDLPALGRYLMFHMTDLFAVFRGSEAPIHFPFKTLALRDFYESNGVPLGEVQSMGLTLNEGIITEFLKGEAIRLGLGSLGPALEVLRVPAWAANRLFRSAALFATIVEDFPYAGNRVWSDDSRGDQRIKVSYAVSSELKWRCRLMRERVREAFKPLKLMFLTMPNTPNYGHPLGTCRMGHHRATSVTNAIGLVHGSRRVFVADGSLFPSSGGSNPGLTIAANALRIADAIETR